MNLRNLAITMLIVAGGLMAFLIYDINKTENSLAQSLTENPMKNTKIHLDGFFKPVESVLLTAQGHAKMGRFDRVDSPLMNEYFTPVIQNFPQVSSMGLANSTGFEFDVIPNKGNWDHRKVWIDEWSDTEYWSKWHFDSTAQEWVELKNWEDKVKNDPRERPWFTGALNSPENKIHWTDPYIYNTTFEIGMTASVNWKDKDDSLDHIMAFDLTLSDVTAFTQQIEVSENGKVFILSDNGEFIGLPKDDSFQTADSIKSALLKMPSETSMKEVDLFYNKWMTELQQKEGAYEFQSEGNYWWGKILKYPISENSHFLVGVLIPEEDILADLQHSKRIIIGSFAFVLILTAFLMYSYGQTRKANQALSSKNQEITQQKLIIEEKNKDILGSIQYAKRLQNAILPNLSEIQKYLPNCFIYYRPKDLVAGDFYWMEKVNDTIYLAAADCTGHGVPGAMVSFVCSNALSKSLIEDGKTDVGQLLDRTRELVIHRFGKSEEQIRDGMDISLVAINTKTNEIQWTGANNPLWIVRKTKEENSAIKAQFSHPESIKIDEFDQVKLIEIKGDKQPIGKYAKSDPFTTHTTVLKEKDAIYMFTDGFPDQFGGKKGKKYKSKNFKRFFSTINETPMNDQDHLLNEEFNRWKTNFEQIDDVCVIGARV